MSVTNHLGETSIMTYVDHAAEGIPGTGAAIAAANALLPSLGLGAGADGSARITTSPAGEVSIESRMVWAGR